MTAFFIKTDSSSAGPFSGVELREAAMAGILRPDSLIGGSPQGPWQLGMDIGLFSDKKMPLPHPPNTAVPQFEIEGLLFKADGPFKLRELIGFAARGMLRPDAKVRSPESPEWHPVDVIPSLKAVLDGRLFMVTADGKVLKPAPVSALATTSQGVTSTAEANSSATNASAHPSSIAETTAESTSKVQYGTEEDIAEYEAEQELLRQKQLEEKERANKENKKRLTLKLPGLSSLKSISPTVLIKPLAAIAVVAILGFAAYAIGNMGTREEHVIGNWISDDNLFAIAFREDGTCICFNTTGKSWTGQFNWTERQSSGFESSEVSSATIDSVDPGDELEAVRSGDGYLRLQSSEPCFIGTHEVADCFVRRVGEKLKIGYPVSASFSGGGSIDAGWKIASRAPPIGLDVLSDLSIMEFEPPRDDQEDDSIPHVSEVIPDMLDMYETGEFDEALSATACYSRQVNAGYLLANYGPPDEARSLFPQELKFLPEDGDYSDAQMARYGVMKMILSSEGRLMFLIMLAG